MAWQGRPSTPGTDTTGNSLPFSHVLTATLDLIEGPWPTPFHSWQASAETVASASPALECILCSCVQSTLIRFFQIFLTVARRGNDTMAKPMLWQFLVWRWGC